MQHRWKLVAVGMGALLMAAPVPSEAASVPSWGAHVGASTPVQGLPSSGPFQLVQDGSGTGNWVLGPGRRLWKLQSTSAGLTAIDQAILPAGRLVPWTDGQMALVTANQVRWIGPSGTLLPTATPIPKGWRWVDGAGIQIRRGRRIFELTARHTWRSVATLPTVHRGHLAGVAVVNEDPYHTGPDSSGSPLYAIWRQGSQTVLDSFDAVDGWRAHALPLVRPHLSAVSNKTVLIGSRPVTALTVAPTDDLATETGYHHQTIGSLNEHSPILTTVHGGVIAAWSPTFFPGERKPLFTVRGVQVLGQADEEILYRPTATTVALVSFQPPPFPPFARPQPIGPTWKETLVRREPEGCDAYLVGRRWISYQSEDSTITVARKAYAVSPGESVADHRRLWLVSANAIWEVGPSGPPRKIPWPKGLGLGLGKHWLQEVFAVASGPTLYAAVGKDIPGSVSSNSQKSPLVHAVLVEVAGHRASVLTQYPKVEGAVTSLAASPDHRLYVALYTGHHNVNYSMNLTGKSVLAGYNLKTHRWRSVPVPPALYQTNYPHSLRGESIISLVVLPGPRLYFLVQFSPNGEDMGLGGTVWALHRDAVHYYNLPAYPMEVPYALTLAPGGHGVLVNGGNTLALLRPREGLGYLGEQGLDATEWLGTRFLSEVPTTHETSVYAVQTPPLRPKFLLHETVVWP